METIKIDILNPKAERLINDLAELDLIAIRSNSFQDFAGVLGRLRAPTGEVPSPEKIA